MLSITINGKIIDVFLSKYQVQIREVYDNKSNFVAIDGTEHKTFLGNQRFLSVDFEPMSQSQMEELFSAIKENRESISISYLDPQLGEVIKQFTCDNLPAATYFETDPKYVYNSELKTAVQETVKFWTVPTINFEETKESWWSG